MSTIETVELYSGIWQLHECGEVSVDTYLLCGKERAVVIDTLCNAKGLYNEVRKITNLPIDVLITHGHFDHVGVSTKEFKQAGCNIYMSKIDVPVLNSMVDEKFDEEFFTDINDGDVFDLGGVLIKTLQLPGHTPGSLVFLDEEREILFSGDAIGSCGFWMQLDTCLSMSTFYKNLEIFDNKIEKYKNLKIWPGHINQMKYKPLDKNYMLDIKYCAKQILENNNIGQEHQMPWQGKTMTYRLYKHGHVEDGIWYSPSNI